MNNNELLVYTLLLVIILLIIGMPKDKLILTQNTSNLVLGFICVTLFMLLDKRIAIIFLILLVVTYYENTKADLDNKVANIQIKNINDIEHFETAATTAATLTPPETTPTPLPVSDSLSMFSTEQTKLNNLTDINKNVNNFKNDLNILKASYLTINDDEICETINKYNNKINEYNEDGFSNTAKEGFLKDYIPQPVPRAKNFKNSNLVKNISNLDTQNVEGQFDIQGCRMLEAKSSAIDYNTNFGPPLAKNEVYQTNETIGTPFYPLSA